MSLTTTADVADQMATKWSSMFMKELRASKPLLELVNKDYEGEIPEQGATVRVSQLTKATGQLQTIGVDADTFDSEKMVWKKVDVVADKVASATFDVSTLAELQSQLNQANSEIRDALMEGVSNQMNDYHWSLINASGSKLRTGQATITAAHLSAIRTLAAKAKWRKDGRWFALLNPDYYGNLLDEQTLVSKDYVDGEAPKVAGQIANKRYGFNILEDDSRVSAKGLFFHPDFLLHVMQVKPTFKVSDMHALGKRGYKITAEVVFGAKIGIDGSEKHIYQTAGASLDPNA